MRHKLIEAMKNLPDLLDKPEIWDSLIVNRRKPVTYRVFTNLPEYRICLHEFDPCHTHEAFQHPHPWAGAFIILDGRYEMNVKLSKDRTDHNPADAITLILAKHSIYEIVNPLTWHSVVPLVTTRTVMINETPWPKEVAHEAVRTTAGKDLDKMPHDALIEHLNMFKKLTQEYLNIV